MSADSPGPVPSSSPPRCTKCGAELPPYAVECPNCRARLVTVDTSDALTPAPKSVGVSAYHLISMMLTIPLIAVFFALYRYEPVFAVLYGALVLPVFVLTTVRAWRRRAEGHPMSAGEKVYFFIKKTSLILKTLILVVLAGIVAYLAISLLIIYTLMWNRRG